MLLRLPWHCRIRLSRQMSLHLRQANSSPKSHMLVARGPSWWHGEHGQSEDAREQCPIQKVTFKVVVIDIRVLLPGQALVN